LDKAGLQATADAFGDDAVLTPYEPGRGLPLFIQPNTAKLYEDTAAALAWLAEKRPMLDRLLLTAGAIVLRGFPIERSVHFARFADSYAPFEPGYVAGTVGRDVIVDQVMSVNTLPPGLLMDIHQEMAYLPRHPKRIAFYCRMPPVSGGATMICDMREATARIDPVLFREVEKRGIRHVRNFAAPSRDPVHPLLAQYRRTWVDTFKTDDPAVAEAACRAVGFETRWCDDGSLETINHIPGIVTHPHTGEQVWFNQVAAIALSARSNPEMSKVMAEIAKHVTRPSFVSTYGDGGEIPLELLEPINPMLRELAVTFSWSHGDIMLIDNYLVGHGRMPFTGKRDIQVVLLDE
jgi:alpha-ketoglutarate-dependent taurine dioxygenase